MSAYPHARSPETADPSLSTPKPTPVPQPANSTSALSGVRGLQRPLTARIGKYEVEAEVEEGSRVQMFRGLDRDTGRPVTLTILTDITDQELQDRFRREVATAAKLRHPALIAIYELGEHVGLPFAAMQHLDGEDLRRVIQSQRPFTLLEKMLIMWQVAEGVQAAHRGGIPHLGIRPAGIVLAADGSVTLQDFGIVRPERNDRDDYAAPEELSGSTTADALCDLFAFGMLYYELLSGRHPFLTGDSEAAVIDILRHDAAPLRRLVPECPEELERIVLRAMAKRRELRYQSLEDLQFDVEPILRELKRDRAVPLLADAQRLVQEAGAEGESLDEAQRLLREVLELDPDNRGAQQLRAGIRLQLQQRTLRSRVEELLREAGEAADARHYGRAVECLTSVLQLDEGNDAVRERLGAIRLLRDKSEQAAQLVDEARKLLAQQSLVEAWYKVTEALDRDPETPGAAGLLQLIEDVQRRQEREANVEHGLAKAKSLLLVESFDEAITLLEALWQECPDSPKVEHWLEHVQAQKVQGERRSRLQGQLSRAGALMAERRFGEAAGLLDKLTAEFPDDERVRDLRTEARAAVVKAAAVAMALERCDECRVEGKLDQAIEVLDAALAAYPGEPELAEMRAEVERRKQAMQSASVVRAALQEVRWLLDQDRPDLAAQFLKEKLAELPDDATLLSRLAEIEKGLPQWEQRRFVQEALNRAALLEQKQQWQVALTVLEEALEAHPGSAELMDAAERFRDRLQEQERRKKLTRRLETIRLRITAHAWPQALSLIEAAQAEFPDEPELKRLLEDVRANLKRSECEAVIAEVRQCLAYGEPEQAEQVLQRALESLPWEPALEVLRQELESDKKYQEGWRAAQVLFGRGQLREAEEILAKIAAPNRPEAQALLETVRGARAATEETDLLGHGREKALKLIQQREFSEAAEVLRDLLLHFPGDPILERDLASIQSELDPPALEAAAPEPSEEELPPVAVVPPPVVAPPVPVAAAAAAWRPTPAVDRVSAPQSRPSGSKRNRLLWLTGTILLVLLAGAVWKLRQSRAAVPSPPAAPTPAQSLAPIRPQVSAPPQQPPPSGPPANAGAGRSRARAQVEPTPREPVRTFVPPAGKSAPRNQAQVSLPPPPGSEVGVALPKDAPLLPASLGQSMNAPAPARPQTAPPVVSGGRLEEAQLISRQLPQIPEFARTRGIVGTVKLEAVVDQTGTVASVKIVSGNPVLAVAAKNAVLKWKYRPARLNGQPVDTTIAIQVAFQPTR